MFCVLNVKTRGNNFYERIFDCFIKDEYNRHTIPVYKGAPFYLLDVSVGKRGISWERVVLEVGKCAQRMVPTKYFDLSEDWNVGYFKSDVLYNKMMKNTLLKILSNNLVNNPKSIFIVDEYGKHTDFTKRVSKYASTLLISTSQKEKYYDICDEITDDNGLCPVLTSDNNGALVRINTNNNVMTIVCENENLNISGGCDFTVPQIYEKLLPEGIEKYNFYSALYELCGVFSLGEGFFDVITVNKEKKCIQDIHFS